jgi:hypothetical protein
MRNDMSDVIRIPVECPVCKQRVGWFTDGPAVCKLARHKRPDGATCPGSYRPIQSPALPSQARPSKGD